MHLANEILKYLVCEICFENFDEKQHVPYTLFPCGHTYCEHCVINFNTNKCPTCTTVIQFKTKNWALINLIPKARIPPVFHDVQFSTDAGLGLLKQYDAINSGLEKQRQDLKVKCDALRDLINTRAEEFVAKIRANQDLMLAGVAECEGELCAFVKASQDLQKNAQDVFEQVAVKLKDEEVKTSEERLSELKNLVMTLLMELNENYEKNAKAKLNLEFSPSNFNFENLLVTDCLFGHLNLSEKEPSAENVSNKKYDFNTYTEIEHSTVSLFFNEIY
jgi:hypothetical protein